MQKSFVLAVAVVVSAVSPCLMTAQRHTRATSQPYIPPALKAVGPPIGVTESVEAFHPTVNIYGINLFMGTTICADHETVKLVMNLYRQYVEDHRADEMTKGESQLERGAPASAPQVEHFGCISVPDGTPMLLEKERYEQYYLSVVDLKIGTVLVRGVTSPTMYRPAPSPTIASGVTPTAKGIDSSVTSVMSDEVMHIGGSVKAPVLIYSVEPELSAEARAEKFSGSVRVSLIVDQQGNPTDVRVEKGTEKGLNEKAVEAVRQYRFKPATLNGKPVKVDLFIDVNFTIF